MKNQLIILLIAILSLTSCKKNGVSNCFVSTGEITMDNRSINSFNSILLKDNVNLILKKADSNSIIVEAGKNLISGVKTDVGENGVLEIRNDNSCNWIRSYKSPINVYLHYKVIDSIDYNSIGDVTTENVLVTDSLWIMAHEGAGQINMDVDVSTLYCSLHYGTLDIILRGKAGVSYIYSASFGFINTLDMESDYMYINNRSSNDIYVRAKTHIGATIDNIGNIYYAGNPITVSFNKNGKGELIELDD